MKTVIHNYLKFLKENFWVALVASGCLLMLWLIVLYFKGIVPLAPEIHTEKPIIDFLVLQFPISRFWDLLIPLINCLIFGVLKLLHDKFGGYTCNAEWMHGNKNLFVIGFLIDVPAYILQISLSVGSVVGVFLGIHYGIFVALCATIFFSGVAVLVIPAFAYFDLKKALRDEEKRFSQSI